MARVRSFASPADYPMTASPLLKARIFGGGSQGACMKLGGTPKNLSAASDADPYCALAPTARIHRFYEFGCTTPESGRFLLARATGIKGFIPVAKDTYQTWKRSFCPAATTVDFTATKNARYLPKGCDFVAVTQCPHPLAKHKAIGIDTGKMTVRK